MPKTQVIASRMPSAEARAVVAWCAANKLNISEGVRKLVSESAREAKPKLTPEQVETLTAARDALKAGDNAAGILLLKKLLRSAWPEGEPMPPELNDDEPDNEPAADSPARASRYHR